MKFITSKRKKALFQKMQEIDALNKVMEKIDEDIQDAIIWNDRNGRILHETEKRMIREKRNELIETLKKS